jgi:hypothetical protein
LSNQLDPYLVISVLVLDLSVEGFVVSSLGGLENGNLLWDLLWSGGLNELIVRLGGGWGLVTSGVGLLVGVGGWLSSSAWGSNWSVLWAVGSVAGLFLAVNTLCAVGSVAYWKVLVLSVDNNWGELNGDSLIIRESVDKSRLNETGRRWASLSVRRLVEEWWGIVDLNVSVFSSLLLEVVWLTLHGNVFAKILITVSSSGKEFGIWKALNTSKVSSLLAGCNLDKTGRRWAGLSVRRLIEEWWGIIELHG